MIEKKEKIDIETLHNYALENTNLYVETDEDTGIERLYNMKIAQIKDGEKVVVFKIGMLTCDVKIKELRKIIPMNNQ